LRISAGSWGCRALASNKVVRAVGLAVRQGEGTGTAVESAALRRPARVGCRVAGASLEEVGTLGVAHAPRKGAFAIVQVAAPSVATGVASSDALTPDEVLAAVSFSIRETVLSFAAIEVAALMRSTCVGRRRTLAALEVASALGKRSQPVELASAAIEVATLMRPTGRLRRLAFAADEVSRALGKLGQAVELAGASIQIAALMRAACRIRCCALAALEVARALGVLGKPVELAATSVEVTTLMRSACRACCCTFAALKVACALGVLDQPIELAHASVQITTLARPAGGAGCNTPTTLGWPCCTRGILGKTIERTRTVVAALRSCASRTCGLRHSRKGYGRVEHGDCLDRADARLGDRGSRRSWFCADVRINAVSVRCIKIHHEGLAFWRYAGILGVIQPGIGVNGRREDAICVLTGQIPPVCICPGDVLLRKHTGVVRRHSICYCC